MVVRKDHTSIKFEVSEFNTALDYLTEHFNVLQSHKDSGEIMIKAQKIINNYSNL